VPSHNRFARSTDVALDDGTIGNGNRRRGHIPKNLGRCGQFNFPAGDNITEHPARHPHKLRLDVTSPAALRGNDHGTGNFAITDYFAFEKIIAASGQVPLKQESGANLACIFIEPIGIAPTRTTLEQVLEKHAGRHRPGKHDKHSLTHSGSNCVQSNDSGLNT
jgi:hypothetical protein